MSENLNKCESEAIEVGRVVKALAGRDKGAYFVAVSVSGGFVEIADGRTRKVESPKRKNIKHISPVDEVYNGELTNKRLRRLLNKYLTHTCLQAEDPSGEVL